jgi:hypothetical protein
MRAEGASKPSALKDYKIRAKRAQGQQTGAIELFDEIDACDAVGSETIEHATTKTLNVIAQSNSVTFVTPVNSFIGPKSVLTKPRVSRKEFWIVVFQTRNARLKTWRFSFGT